jgi:archaellum component FlaC
MWGQRNSKYAAAVGTQLLSKIHCLESQLRDVGHLQNHPVDKLQEQVNFVGDATDRVGRVVDKLNKHINLQDVQIEQLANMVNDLVGKVEGQAKEIKNLKADRESHQKVINMMTAKVITLEQCVEDVQKKAFPQVRELDS